MHTNQASGVAVIGLGEMGMGMAGSLPLVPYHAPGNAALADPVRGLAARLYPLLRGCTPRLLNPAQVADLQRRFPA